MTTAATAYHRHPHARHATLQVPGLPVTHVTHLPAAHTLWLAPELPAAAHLAPAAWPQPSTYRPALQPPLVPPLLGESVVTDAGAASQSGPMRPLGTRAAGSGAEAGAGAGPGAGARVGLEARGGCPGDGVAGDGAGADGGGGLVLGSGAACLPAHPTSPACSAEVRACRRGAGGRSIRGRLVWRVWRAERERVGVWCQGARGCAGAGGGALSVACRRRQQQLELGSGAGALDGRSFWAQTRAQTIHRHFVLPLRPLR